MNLACKTLSLLRYMFLDLPKYISITLYFTVSYKNWGEGKTNVNLALKLNTHTPVDYCNYLVFTASYGPRFSPVTIQGRRNVYGLRDMLHCRVKKIFVVKRKGEYIYREMFTG